VLKKWVLLGLASGILVACVPAGCAGGDDPSKEEYVSKLNAMCEDFSSREQEIGDPQMVADVVEWGPRILEAFEIAIANRVGALDAPDEVAEQADRLTDIADQQREVLGGLVDAAKKGDFAEVRRLASQNEALNMESSSIARDLGADACT
jgi:hypothetical protein